VASYDFDLFVIGAGSGGVRASRMSASHGARVAIAEERYLGGTCVNVGCIPKKLLVYASHFAEDFEAAADGYGWSREGHAFSWPTLIANKDKEIERLNGIYADLLDKAGVKRIEGRARLEDPHTVSVGAARYTAENILVAVGGWPSIPEFPGNEHVISSNEAFYLQDLPQRALVVGGGYIACEFAGIFNGLGSDVVQIYRGPLFLRGFDEDVRSFLADEIRKKGVDLRFDLNVTSVEERDDGLHATLTDGSTVVADTILAATGRRPLTQDLGLEACGVKMGDRGEVVVDAYSRSSVPHIWAIGDVTDRVNLTPVAIHEAMCLANTLFRGDATPVDHETVAKAVFSQPAIGSVGLTEAEARDKYAEVDVYLSTFRPLLHTLTGHEEKTLMKLVVDRASDGVVGLHMVGESAAEITQGFAVAMKCGAKKADFDATIGIHPTSAEEFVTMREPVTR